MAKRGLVNPDTKHTDDWNGDDKVYAEKAVDIAEERASRPRLGLRTARWLRSVKIPQQQ